MSAHGSPLPPAARRSRLSARLWHALLGAHPSWWWALALAVLTFVALLGSAHAVGYVRDEGVYFEASRHHARWLTRVAAAPSRLTDRELRDSAFVHNHEHPALMKIAAGASARLLARPAAKVGVAKARDQSNAGGLWPVLDEGTAMRVPAMLMAALAVFLLARIGGARAGPAGAALAAGAFITLPHVAFHAHLHAFDVPVAAAILATVLAWSRARDSNAWAVACGVCLGIAISIKHNALFVGPLLLAHHGVGLAIDGWRARKAPHLRALFAPRVLALALAPAVFVAAWPWLWHDTGHRVAEYLGFHRAHPFYNVEVLGENLNRPPLPMHYPWLMTWATVPTCLLALSTLGAAVALSRARSVRPVVGADAIAHDDQAPLGDTPSIPASDEASPVSDEDERTADRWGLLVVMFAVFPLVLIGLPSVPIFGGTKHWITAYPFLALLAVEGWVWLRERVDLGPRARVPVGAAAVALLLLPSLWGTIASHPLGLSQYAPMVGGARGAAGLGLQRGFWGPAVVDLLPPPGAPAPSPGPIDIHDLHELSRRQYVREGRWPIDWEVAPIRWGGRARSALMFYERHMLRDEVEIWNALERTDPRVVVTLDDVPVAALYSE